MRCRAARRLHRRVVLRAALGGIEQDASVRTVAGSSGGGEVTDDSHERAEGEAGSIVSAARYPSYPAYRDSGVEWIGEVPAHWQILQIGRLGALRKCNGGTKADELIEGVPCIRYGDLYTYHAGFITESRAYISAAQVSDYTPIRYGDVLFAASGETIDEIGKSAVNLMKIDACCGGDVILLRTSCEVDPKVHGIYHRLSTFGYSKGDHGARNHSDAYLQ